ncbi:hypothetical protein ACLOJK_026779 [Asimina triloba]
MNPMLSPISDHQEQKIKKKRNLPGNPDPEAEVIALSPKTLMTTNRFVCEICNKGFQRDQNLQLHRRGHNLPWKLRQRNSKEMRKRVYVCPEPSCIHHHPSRALGDLTGIKKHYCRKHGEKKWKCEKCSKRYAVHSDWKAHSKTCGTREYRCDCGTLFSSIHLMIGPFNQTVPSTYVSFSTSFETVTSNQVDYAKRSHVMRVACIDPSNTGPPRDSFVSHRAFCDALAEESARLSRAASTLTGPSPPLQLPPGPTINPSPLFPHHHAPAAARTNLPFSLLWLPTPPPNSSTTPINISMDGTRITDHSEIPSFFHATVPQKQGERLITPPPPYHHGHLTNPTSSSHQMVSAAAAASTDDHCMDAAAVSDVQGSHMEAVGDMIMWPAAYGSSRGGLFGSAASSTWQKKDDQMTRDFLGLAADDHQAAVNVRDLLSFTNHLDFAYDRDHTLTWGDC